MSAVATEWCLVTREPELGWEAALILDDLCTVAALLGPLFLLVEDDLVTSSTLG